MLRRIICLCLALIMFSPTLWAEDCAEPAGRIVSIEGRVEYKKGNTVQWLQAKPEVNLCADASVRVHALGRAAIRLENQTMLRLDQNTVVTFPTRKKEDDSWFSLLEGIIHVFTRTPHTLHVETPFVNAGVEGTEFILKTDQDHSEVIVIEGKVRARSPEGEVLLNPGESVTAAAGKGLVRGQVVNPLNAVQWALYYPPVGVKESGSETSRRASRLLAVGRVEEAVQVLQKATSENGGDAVSLALMATIAVAQNRNQEALSNAHKAVAADPESSTAYMALSYAQQADFELQQALESVENILELYPDNALSWARFAELQLSLGELDKALVSAQRAVKLDATLSRTQTILGFAQLTGIELEQAEMTFKQAISLDQADPLPRLGLGLAHIGLGDLRTGREQIEIAASLNPNSALIRSYLGKAYYEEKRSEQASKQFDLARFMDPHDPTPWFYDAIRKQSENRPIDALDDLRRSIELNDNRAVYRSRLLLDQDLAARSSSLGRIYTDLGFHRLALIEGWKSVYTDPGDFSGHRLLADTYAALPRHEYSRISELLQAQLLQPISINPVQPQLAESTLIALNGAGPADTALNEFNPLFQRNKIATLQFSGVAGTKNTLGDELTISGIVNNVSYSLGQYHHETDGYSVNSDQETDIANLFVQSALSSQTSVLAEFRSSKLEFGDIGLTFIDISNPSFRQSERFKTGRLGLRHAFNADSMLLAAYTREDADLSLIDKTGETSLDADVEMDVSELRFLGRAGDHNINVGFWKIKKDSTNKQSFGPFINEDNSTVRHANIYGYWDIKTINASALTLGLSADFPKGYDDEITDDQLNPKLGMKWYADTATILRAAAARTIQRPFLSDKKATPTLEPTQIAGFNQYYPDPQGTDAWLYGLAVDRRVANNIYVGSEISKRDIKIPVSVASSKDVLRSEWSEKKGLVYLHWIPSTEMAVSAGYIYERFEHELNDQTMAPGEYSVLTTRQIPLSVRYFHPLGLTGHLSIRYIKQNGNFVDNADFNYVVVPGHDSFWIVDAGVSYRFPKRYGMLSLEAKNLFDKEFRYQETDTRNTRISSDRVVLLKFTLSF